MKVAIVHDWLVGGGAERVVQELHKLYPEAPIYTSYCSPEWRRKLDNKVVTGYLQRWPFSKLRKFLPVLRLHWFSHLDLSGYDVVISSAGNGEAKAIRCREGTLHICYCHTPTHYYWRHYDQYMRNPGFGAFNSLARVGLRLLVAPLRRRDFQAAQRVDYFIANSTHIQSDIKEYYSRDSTVIHPPLQLERFLNDKAPVERHGLITIGRLTPYKRVDLIVEACSQLGVPLTVVGKGSELEHLKFLAGPTITFDSQASDAAVENYLRSAKVFLFAAYEDFGITPVEAIAAGTPVIAYQAGGALDYVEDGKTGLFFKHQAAASLTEAIERFDSKDFSAQYLQAFAKQFDSSIFRTKMRAFIASHKEKGQA